MRNMEKIYIWKAYEKTKREIYTYLSITTNMVLWGKTICALKLHPYQQGTVLSSKQYTMHR